ncbi:hypothetical protein CS063_15720 [Sporanaerobium hydrogeniformans]|uniref:Uncharacterized protein n=1 Tax=Sporanaerobium hydrogeniformans TaxID=3072179 RepID=A0AC61D7E1_9FIRM|nr:hypothetical protein [Sporanaerobium hydrogeniformans]PHV69444.1 hypothetical protein CS063_15720 [Sporanaerobium hydrogeniformans]
MTRKNQLNLSHILKDLTTDLAETVREICPTPSDSFERQINRFTEKYNVIISSSLDELLEASVKSNSYLSQEETPLSELSKHITS